jgi:hypothetical protein
MAASPWKLNHFLAHATIDGLSGSVHLLEPARGIELKWRNAACVIAFRLQLDAVAADSTASTLEAWIRGDDLVASYAERPGRLMRGQVYWRAHRWGDMEIPAIDLIASVQTSLLDSDPSLHVISNIPAGKVLCLTDGATGRAVPLSVSDQQLTVGHESSHLPCFLFRLADGESSYIEMIHPADFAESDLTNAATDIQLSNRLFGGRLEKGVIVRSRMRAFFAPRDRDVELARACFAEFAASDPPLTV